MENEDTRNQEVHEGRQRDSRRKRKLEAEDKKSGLNRKAEAYHWTNLLTKLGPGLHRVTKIQNTLIDAGRRPLYYGRPTSRHMSRIQNLQAIGKEFDRSSKMWERLTDT